MMKLVLIALFAAAALGAPQAPRQYYGPGYRQGPYTPILRQNYDLNPYDNSYNFGYESADGSARSETGVIKNRNTPIEALSVTGSYNYVDTNGQLVTVNYIADENGFQPIGNNIHPAIVKATQAQVAFARSQPPYVYNPRQYEG